MFFEREALAANASNPAETSQRREFWARTRCQRSRGLRLNMVTLDRIRNRKHGHFIVFEPEIFVARFHVPLNLM